MNPVSHFLISWTVANSADLPRRDRVLVTWSGVIPDIDGVGIIAEWLTENSTAPLIWYSRYHHIVGHNLAVGLILTAAVFLISVRRWISAFLALLAFHLHLLADLLGSRGPDGYQWPIPYCFPFAPDRMLVWDGQWELNAWPNLLIILLFFIITLYLSWLRGHTPLEAISLKADKALVAGLRKKFGSPLST